MSHKKLIRASLLTELTCWNSLIDAENVLKMHSCVNSRRAQRSIINAAVVMLVAHWEAYVECLFVECVNIHYHGLTDDERRQIVKTTAGRMNTPDSYSINMLFLYVGIANILGRVRWRNMAPERICKKLNLLVSARHFIAHGQQSRNEKFATKAQVKEWLKFVNSLKLALAHAAMDQSKPR